MFEEQIGFILPGEGVQVGQNPVGNYLIGVPLIHVPVVDPIMVPAWEDMLNNLINIEYAQFLMLK